jgi:hypothetical protein
MILDLRPCCTETLTSVLSRPSEGRLLLQILRSINTWQEDYARLTLIRRKQRDTYVSCNSPCYFTYFGFVKDKHCRWDYFDIYRTKMQLHVAKHMYIL